MDDTTSAAGGRQLPEFAGRGLSPEAVSAATATIVQACRVVHPTNSHHPCGDCSGAILAMQVALDKQVKPVPGRTPSPDEERVFDELVASGQEQSGRSTTPGDEGDGLSAVAYVQSVMKAHPEMDARTLLAQASYVFAADGFQRARRAAHVELFPVTAPASSAT